MAVVFNLAVFQTMYRTSISQIEHNRLCMEINDVQFVFTMTCSNMLGCKKKNKKTTEW